MLTQGTAPGDMGHEVLTIDFPVLRRRAGCLCKHQCFCHSVATKPRESTNSVLFICHLQLTPAKSPESGSACCYQAILCGGEGTGLGLLRGFSHKAWFGSPDSGQFIMLSCMFCFLSGNLPAKMYPQWVCKSILFG